MTELVPSSTTTQSATGEETPEKRRKKHKVRENCFTVGKYQWYVAILSFNHVRMALRFISFKKLSTSATEYDIIISPAEQKLY